MLPSGVRAVLGFSFLLPLLGINAEPLDPLPPGKVELSSEELAALNRLIQRLKQQQASTNGSTDSAAMLKLLTLNRQQHPPMWHMQPLHTTETAQHQLQTQPQQNGGHNANTTRTAIGIMHASQLPTMFASMLRPGRNKQTNK